MSSLSFFEPMLAESVAQIPKNDDCRYIFEEKYDGMRVLLVNNKLVSRHGTRVDHAFPELQKELKKLSKHSVFDGELVIFREGLCDFDLVQERRSMDNPFTIKYYSNRYPARLMLFDCLVWEGEPIMNYCLWERKKLLNDVSFLNGGFVQTVPFSSMVDEIVRDGIEGVIAKDVKQEYYCGKRLWKKYRFMSETVVKIVEVEDHPAGCLLHTEEGWRINLAGKKRTEKAKRLFREGEFKVEISYFEKTKKGELRFAKFKRFLERERF